MSNKDPNEEIEIRLRVPRFSQEKLKEIQFYSHSRSRRDAFIVATDIAADVLEQRYLESRPALINATRSR